jgi:hypothetical protein
MQQRAPAPRRSRWGTGPESAEATYVRNERKRQELDMTQLTGGIA